MRFFPSAMLVFLLVTVQMSQAGANTRWVITASNWSQQNELDYERFVHNIGIQQCNTLQSCLTSSANPYYSDPREMSLFQSVPFDCAKLPYVLRAYFAWKNGLPFSYTSSIHPIGDVGASGDERYSQFGNTVTGRETIRSGSDAISDIMDIASTVNTAMFRIPPDQDVNGNLFPDFYSADLTRDQIHPGTALYDPNGHVAVVYQVENDGRIRFMDAHPDRSLTHGTYGQEFMRSRPAAGAGFKNWRPVTYSAGSHPQGAHNDDIQGYSLKQYFGNRPSSDGSWSGGQFVISGRTMDYYEYLRNALAAGQLKYNPADEETNMMRSICSDLHARVDSVDSAIAAGMPSQAHPDRLPGNIYGTSGDWENYSSPSRDARLKASFHELRTQVEHMVQLVSSRSPQVSYAGDAVSLGRDLLGIYDREARACVISYKKSDGSTQRLSFEQIRQRLFNLSFDPYHCAELRWGASGAELNSCTSDSNKMEWYKGEARLRNQIERDYNIMMNFSVDDLLSANPPRGSGVDQHADVDTRAYLVQTSH
jgi:hypothetical protein